MDFAANFTAIDFETANRRPDSACQLAAVRVRDGQIVNSAKWMIRPEPFFFARGNISIHGIHPQDVQDEPTFGDLWPEVQETFGSDCLVAHNASFDIGVLLACLTRHNQPAPELHYTCTRAIAKKTWPNRRRYGLKPLSDWLGIRFQHHDALEDSIACAKILIAAGIDKQVDSLDALEKKLRITRGAAGEWGKRGPGRNVRPKRKTTKVSEPTETYRKSDEPTLDLQRMLIRADFIRPLAGKRIVFAGKFNVLSQQDAELLAFRSGGECEESVSASTDCLIMGSMTNSDANLAHRDDEKRQTAEKLNEDGTGIRILKEQEFLGLLGRTEN